MSTPDEELAGLQDEAEKYLSLLTEYKDTIDRLEKELINEGQTATRLRNIRYYKRDMQECISKLGRAKNNAAAFKQEENEKRLSVLMLAFTPGKSGSLSVLPVDIVRDMIILKHDTFPNPSERRS